MNLSELSVYTVTARVFVRRLLVRSMPLVIRSVAASLLIGIVLGPVGGAPVFADTFQFIEAPIPMSNVSDTNWYGNINFAQGKGKGFYNALQGFHSGVDFLLPEGNPIRSTVNRTGKVISINNVQYGWGADPGNVAVDYGDYIVLYGHTLKTPPVGKQVKQVGEQVNFGDVIAYSGSDDQKPTPLPHLHLEVIEKTEKKPCSDSRPGCIRTNPVPFFSTSLHKEVEGKKQDGPSNFYQWPKCDQWLSEFDQPDITPAAPLYKGCSFGDISGLVKILGSKDVVIGATVKFEGGGTTQTTTTDNRGGYLFRNVPAGNARITVTKSNFSSVSVDTSVFTRGSATAPVIYLKKNGSVSSTSLQVEVGIYDLTDKYRKTDQLSPFDPKNPQRDLEVQILNNSNNDLVDSKSLTVQYNSAKRAFTGSVDLGNFQPGPHIVRLKLHNTLQGEVAGIPMIVQGSNTLPKVVLNPGDINGDSALNILDYNLLRDCYKNLLPAESCNDADLNDDGEVNEFDYNIMVKASGR